MACALSRGDHSEESTRVKFFITSYAEDFFSERELLRKEIQPELETWSNINNIKLEVYHIKWGSKHAERRDFTDLKAMQSKIEDCYYNNVMPIFLNFTSETLGWVPTWGDYHHQFIESYLKSYGLTSLDLEVMYGAYREDNLNSLFLYRSDSFLESLPQEEKCAFPQKMGKSDALVSETCNKINQRFPPDRIIKYKPVYKGLTGKRKRPKLQFNDCLKEMICEFVKMRILHDYLGHPCHRGMYYDHMARQLHESFMLKKSERVMGREKIINEIEEYIVQEKRDVPLILVGGAGSGKSSVLCKAAALISKKASEDLKSASGKSWHVFYHFVGAVPGSTTVEVMLKRLLREMDRINVSYPTLPQRYTEAVKTDPFLCFPFSPPIQDMARDLLQSDVGNEICLSDDQLNDLMTKESSENPLWLAVACEELKHVNNGEINQKINDLPNGLLNLLAEVLTRLENTPQGNLITATLCLLEASSVGLLESELRQILGNEATLMPPSPFDEKEEKESSEKESTKHCQSLPEEKWQEVYSTLKPFLRPYGDSKEGRIDFYHRAVSKAVRKIYFEPEESELDKGQSYYWWHKKLADFFQNTPNTDRMIEEYPYQLVCLDDTYRLSKCLCDWRIFDVLYHEEYSSVLLSLWRKVGTANAMVSAYEKALSEFEEEENIMEELVSIRYEKVCRVVIQAGKNHEALELLKTAMKIEEKELGARNHRMVELYALMAEIYDEKLKLNDFVSPSQLPDLRKAISYGKKAIALRKKLSGRYHKFKLGMSLMKLAFNMESWEACGGSTEMPGSEALAEGNRCIDVAIKIFQELNDIGHYAEALMTKGVLATRGSMEQLKLYNQAMDLCMQMYGEYHILTSRLYINIGIVYEDNKEYRKAYEYFKKWARVSEEILGPDHPKTRRAKGVLQETRYRRIAQELGEWDYDGDTDGGESYDDDDDEDDEMENPDLEHYYDDAISRQTDSHRNQYRLAAAAAAAAAVVVDNTEIEAMEDSVEGAELDNRADNNVGSNSEDEDDDDDDSEHGNFEYVVGQERPATRRYFSNNSSSSVSGVDSNNQHHHQIDRNNRRHSFDYAFDLDDDDDSDREHSDNENFFDDNCEDYDEQYTLLVDHIPAIEEVSVRLDRQADQCGGDVTPSSAVVSEFIDDNRFADDDTEQDTDFSDIVCPENYISGHFQDGVR
ncbi:nephrocystin-3 [Octopus sinensis]|uniref:Nephrocystin-3 n=1 Tax=Octopus sinensis TaxID=2607531 RepID=A0A7E6FPZ9_9MOLL|nr:nephrocystin-3 [Octopus sinensis]